MAVKIRLKRFGKKRAPFYRVVVADSRTKRDGRSIEEIGVYDPQQEPSLISIDSERAQYWLSVGAQPTEQVAVLLKHTGDLAKHRGDANAESTVKVAEAKEAFVADASKASVIKPVVEEPAAAEEVADEAPEAADADATEVAPAADEPAAAEDNA